MKKIYILLAMVLALAIGSGTTSYAVTITSHNEYDSCGSNSSYSFFVSTASSSLSGVSYFGDGTSSPDMFSGNYAYISHQFALPGIYTIKHVLYNSSLPVDSVIFTDTVMCQNGFITAYLDVNSNCAWDPGEPFLSSPIDVEIDSAGVKIDTVTILGGAYRPLTAGKSYSMKLLNVPAGINVTCPTGGVRSATVGYSGPTIYSFGMQCGTTSTGFDVAEYVSTRTGRHSEMADIIVTNNHCTPQSVTLTANMSPKYGLFVSANPTPTSRVGNVLTWSLPNVSAFASYHVYIHYETGGSTSSWLLPGDTVHTSYYLTPTTGDTNPSNNTVVRVDTVTSSFDPNAKSVFPSGNIAAGTLLQYAIEFENDGNAPARNIHVLDTLSGSLDVNSMKIVSSTAPITNTTVVEAGGSKILRFDMPGINLLDSSHHGQCTGMVVFTIKAKSALAQGTVITNRAGIYFDDNPVVMTNSAQNRIPVSGVGVTAITPDALSAYPNPVHDVLTIKADGDYQSAQLISALGQVVMERNISGKTTIDVSALVNGIYYLVLKGQAGTTAQKIEKQ